MRFLAPLVLLISVSALCREADVFDARIRGAEAVVARFYRGERPRETRRRLNERVDAFNARVEQWNARLGEARAAVEAGRGPMGELEGQVAALDRRLASHAQSPDGESPSPRPQLLEQRNALVLRYNRLAEGIRTRAEAYDALAAQSQRELGQEREQLQGAQDALAARVAAFESFRRDGGDLLFFRQLNALLAEIRERIRNRGEAAGLAGDLARVRALRRELASWAAAEEAEQGNGLILVEGRVGDEPCWFILDTGAQRVCVSPELILAAGFGAFLGKESTLVLAGGVKIRGREIELPEVSLCGQRVSAVAGSAVPASEVGVDGLLGQSFLRSFVYTIDSAAPSPLQLLRRVGAAPPS
nr:aspartyl protease family protein [uncultured Holophaga sp.]